MSYRTLLAELHDLEDAAYSEIARPRLKLIVNRVADYPAPAKQSSLSRCLPLQLLRNERTVEEVEQWQSLAHDNVHRRLAGQVPEMPLSPEDAAVYRRLVNQRAERIIEDLARRDLSVLSVSGERIIPDNDM